MARKLSAACHNVRRRSSTFCNNILMFSTLADLFCHDLTEYRPRRSPPVCEFVKMSKGQTLRALVNERLAAAAEDIFVLFERTIAEYEEELCRSKEENQWIKLVRGNVQIPSSPGPSLNQEITETPQIKEEPEEQSVTQEEQQLPVSVPESSGVCVKTEESSLLQQRQTEHQEETQGEDISSEPHFFSETEGDTDNDDDWEPAFSCSAAQMETEADGDHYNQVHTRDRGTELSPQNKSAPETTVHSEDMSGAEDKQHQCSICRKKFGKKQNLQRHIQVHTGDRPFSCSTCKKSFSLKRALDVHVRTHTGEKPYSCSFCEKTFTSKGNLDSHNRIHTGERPYSCPVCKKTFTQKSSLDYHTTAHKGERPYSCSICLKSFTLKGNLERHSRTHTGEKPYSCPHCKKGFIQKCDLVKHERIHTGERPYSCLVCKKTFTQKGHLDSHGKTHTREEPLPTT